MKFPSQGAPIKIRIWSSKRNTRIAERRVMDKTKTKASRIVLFLCCLDPVMAMASEYLKLEMSATLRTMVLNTVKIPY